MGKFSNQPGLDRLDSRTWQTSKIMIYVLDDDVASWAHFDEVVVPVGFKTDGASIPRGFWWLIGSPFTGKYLRAALVHDYLYSVQITDRGVADRIMERGMRDDGVC